MHKNVVLLNRLNETTKTLMSSLECEDRFTTSTCMLPMSGETIIGKCICFGRDDSTSFSNAVVLGTPDYFLFRQLLHVAEESIGEGILKSEFHVVEVCFVRNTIKNCNNSFFKFFCKKCENTQKNYKFTSFLINIYKLPIYILMKKKQSTLKKCFFYSDALHPATKKKENGVSPPSPQGEIMVCYIFIYLFLFFDIMIMCFAKQPQPYIKKNYLALVQRKTAGSKPHSVEKKIKMFIFFIFLFFIFFNKKYTYSSKIKFYFFSLKKLKNYFLCEYVIGAKREQFESFFYFFWDRVRLLGKVLEKELEKRDGKKIVEKILKNFI
ncbi:hypothetical protein RFI_00955 [Reticulomyxa filosa]|uniref:Uncharacterized protein n=1 Tax=Reticulomyxa filosa TaxID=46433 RepID=X6PEI6_RETFI|nr:hypothetical protein RFI_00955 [Reticulomyxa filosa]|eukprot:ETO36107.1 hypothetical protein RFI_00955 [Reticulomyxa filosa]